MLEATGFGDTGPYKDFAGFAPIFASFGGLSHLTGYKDGAPNPMSGVQDLRAGTQAAFAIMAALIHRQKTGEGQYIDVSSSECLTTLVGNEMMEFTMNGRSPSRCGNEDSVMAPHNVYRCKGEDKWISIAVGSDEEWRSLSKAMGRPELAQKAEYADTYSRHRNREELDQIMSAWTIQYTHMELMEMLQAVAVAAMPSFSASEILEDPHTKAREMVTTVDHVLLKEQYVINPPWKLSETPATIREPGPCLGEDNEEVFTTLLGLSAQRVQQLVDEKILY
jgi:crotonobetainyl-CoA:carnitine CoA-transferase CaiB-like acyl-CoA transferase